MLLYINKGSQLRGVERAILPYTLHAATKGDLVYYRHPNWNLLGKRYASAHSLVVSSSIRSNCIMQERTAIPGHGETSRPKRPGPSLTEGVKICIIFNSSSGKRSTSTSTLESPWCGIGIHDNATATRVLHKLLVQGDAQASLRAYVGPASGPEAVNHPSLIHGTLRCSM